MALQTSHVLPSRRRLAAASSLLLAVTALAQQPSSQDPANLAGEHVSAPALADTLAIDHGAPALAQLLKKLRTRASLMMIVAHPDDEDGGMLTYESRGQGARVAMLTLTRGEGGQNLMSADFNDALGLIRTQELLAADRYFGIDQFFGSVVDFGFSKTREETLDQWTHERVLYDAVRAVRLYRPLVLTSVFIGGVTDGHGHHQVSGQMNQEVFEAAADPKVFPEMGLPVWAPLKVYARVPFARISKDGMFDYATGKSSPPRFYNYVTKKWTTTPPSANVMIPEGNVGNEPGMDGESYVQFAREGLALQKTQIGINVRIPRAGANDTPYTRYASRVPAMDKESSFFEGIDITLPGIADLAPDAPKSLRASLEAIDKNIAEAQRLFTTKHPEASVPSLSEARDAFGTLIGTITSSGLPATQKFSVLHELKIKQTQCTKALILAQGLVLKASVANGEPLLSTATSATISYSLENNGTTAVDLSNRWLRIAGADHATGTTHLGKVHEGSTSPLDPSTLKFGKGLNATRPYFSRPNLEQPFYDISNPELRNAPVTPAPVFTTVDAHIVDSPAKLGILLPLVPNVAASSHDHELQPAVVVPPVSISITPQSGILPITGSTIQLKVHLASEAGGTGINGGLHLQLPEGWTSKPAAAQFDHLGIGPGIDMTFTVTPAHIKANARYTLKAAVTVGGHEYTEGYRAVGYPGLTYTNMYTPSTFKITAVDVNTAPDLKIGYLPGTGDEVAMYLPGLGVTPTLLSVKDLSNLKQYDAVLLGVRAYAAHPELAGSTALLDYAKAGGVVIVQYNTARYGDAQAPYPIEVPGDSAHNVVVEAQPVQILAPAAPLMSWPNQLTARDFSGWIEELGHGFAASWDSKFEALTETHDPDQDPQKGGLLYARTGRGAYVYLAYALYRQLPEGVPGAYRLLANLISLPKNPGAGIQQPAQ